MFAITHCDYFPNGEPKDFHFVDLRPDSPDKMQHPDDPKQQITAYEFVKILQTRKDLREQGGWHIQTGLPGVPDGWTKWNCLVQEANGVRATEHTKALGLTHE